MIPTRLPPQSDPPLSPRLTLPTMYDLPSENPEESGLPDEFHLYQPQLLRETFKPPGWNPEMFSLLLISISTTMSGIFASTNAQIGLLY